MSNSENKTELETQHPDRHIAQHPAQHDTGLEAAIDRLLARQPDPTIPAGFAARVRATLPPAAPAKARISTARSTAFAAAAALLIAVFCIAPHTAPSFTSLAFDVELSLLAELACIATWLATPHREL
jgi:hypothetical protein